jgi:hypothetical protein
MKKDFLQMGFITIAQESPMRWVATSGLKIYAVLAIPLIGVTMLIYGCIEICQRPREAVRRGCGCGVVV